MVHHIIGTILLAVILILAWLVIGQSVWVMVLVLFLLAIAVSIGVLYQRRQERQEERSNFRARVEKMRKKFNSFKELYGQTKISYDQLNQQYPKVLPQTLGAKFKEINMATLELELDLLVTDSSEHSKRNTREVADEFEKLAEQIDSSNETCRKIEPLFKQANQAKTESESLLELLPDQFDSVAQLIGEREVADADKIEFDVAKRRFKETEAVKNQEVSAVNWIELLDSLREIQKTIADVKRQANASRKKS